MYTYTFRKKRRRDRGGGGSEGGIEDGDGETHDERHDDEGDDDENDCDDIEMQTRSGAPGLYAHNATAKERSYGPLNHVSEFHEGWPVDVVEIIDPSLRSKWFPLFGLQTDWSNLSWYVYGIMNCYFVRALHSMDERLSGEGRNGRSYVRFQYQGRMWFSDHNEARNVFDEARLKHPMFPEPIELFTCWSTWDMVIHCTRKRRFDTYPNDANVYLTRYVRSSSTSFECCKDIVSSSQPLNTRPYSGLIGCDPPSLSSLLCRKKKDMLKLLLMATCVFFLCIVCMLSMTNKME